MPNAKNLGTIVLYTGFDVKKAQYLITIRQRQHDKPRRCISINTYSGDYLEKCFTKITKRFN